MNVFSLRAKSVDESAALSAALERASPGSTFTTVPYVAGFPGQEVEFFTEMGLIEVWSLVGGLKEGASMLRMLWPVHAAGNTFEPNLLPSAPPTVRFGMILIGQDFLRKGWPTVWRRVQGQFAIPVESIGLGENSSPLDIDEMVTFVPTFCSSGQIAREVLGLIGDDPTAPALVSAR